MMVFLFLTNYNQVNWLQSWCDLLAFSTAELNTIKIKTGKKKPKGNVKKKKIVLFW